MKCVAGHQPNLYPYGGFFAKLASVDFFVIVDNTQYVKKEYHNRNRLKLLDGEAHWISIPVLSSGRFTQKICEVEIAPSSDWRRVHLRTMSANYRRAEHFGDFFPVMESLLARDWTHLADFNIAFIREVMDFLSIRTPVARAGELGISGKASELILDICRKSSSGAYLHGKHSRDYVDFGMLESNGISNLIQDFTPIPYRQTIEPFIPNLSVLDMLFNLGKNAFDVIMQGNTVSSP